MIVFNPCGTEVAPPLDDTRKDRMVSCPMTAIAMTRIAAKHVTTCACDATAISEPSYAISMGTNRSRLKAIMSKALPMMSGKRGHAKGGQSGDKLGEGRAQREKDRSKEGVAQTG